MFVRWLFARAAYARFANSLWTIESYCHAIQASKSGQTPADSDVPVAGCFAVLVGPRYSFTCLSLRIARFLRILAPAFG